MTIVARAIQPRYQPRMGQRRLEQAGGGVEVPADERQAQPGDVENDAVTLDAEALRVRLVPTRLVLVAEVGARGGAHEQRAGVPDARRLGVGLHALDGPRAELPDALPRAEQLLHLDEDGDAVEPVVRGQRQS